MYLYRTLASIYKKNTRKEFLVLTKSIAKEKNKSRLYLMLDMFLCSLCYGTLFTEYYDLDFIKRTLSNRKTFLTTYYNFILYDRLNNREYRNYFRNKAKFYKIFDKFLKRQWVDINDKKDFLGEFFKNKESIVLKNRYGDSGKSVIVYNIKLTNSVDSIITYMKENDLDLAETLLINHPKLAYFNSSSLNTVRVVTINYNDKIEILFAGLRIGAKGSKVDNISQGGMVAPIDIKTGIIVDQFHSKRSSKSKFSLEGINEVGYQLPFWNQVLNMAREASNVIPQISYIAWDIAITPDGPAIVEGNESFGSVILQAHVKHNEHGLKPRLEEIFYELGIELKKKI